MFHLWTRRSPVPVFISSLQNLKLAQSFNVTMIKCLLLVQPTKNSGKYLRNNKQVEQAHTHTHTHTQEEVNLHVAQAKSSVTLILLLDLRVHALTVRLTTLSFLEAPMSHCMLCNKYVPFARIYILYY